SRKNPANTRTLSVLELWCFLMRAGADSLRALDAVRHLSSFRKSCATITATASAPSFFDSSAASSTSLSEVGIFCQAFDSDALLCSGVGLGYKSRCRRKKFDGQTANTQSKIDSGVITSSDVSTHLRPRGLNWVGLDLRW